MRKLMVCGVLAVIVASATASLVSADSSAWRARTMDCGAAGAIDFVLPPSEFATALVPVHEKGGTRVLTILEANVDGSTLVAKPLAAKDADRLVSCSYVDPAGRRVVLTGILTPAS